MLLQGKISPLIIKIISGGYLHSDLVEFVHVCKSFAETFLRTQHYYNKLFFSTNHPSKISDLALDVIGPLFARDDHGCFYELKRFFEPYLADVEFDENLALVHLRRLVVSKARQELINFFKQEDPSGWRIYRNLQLAPKRNANIGVFKDFDRLHYYYKPAALNREIPSGLRPELNEIPDEKLEQRFLHALKLTKKTPEVVEVVLKNLSEEDEYRLFVSRKKLFQALKAVWGFDVVPMNDFQFAGDLNVDLQQTLSKNQEGILGELIVYLNDVVNKTYMEKQKATSEETAAYESILEAYFLDLLSCGSPQKLPYYIDHCSKDGELKKNWNLHKNRLEYMIKLGKKHMRESWEQGDFRIG